MEEEKRKGRTPGIPNKRNRILERWIEETYTPEKHALGERIKLAVKLSEALIEQSEQKMLKRVNLLIWLPPLVWAVISALLSQAIIYFKG